MPAILGLSDEILLRKIEFLVNEAAMEPQYIVERPVLLALSLEKRLVVRHYVMKVLREKGLLDSRTSFYTFAKLGEGAFKLRFLALQMLMLQLVLVLCPLESNFSISFCVLGRWWNCNLCSLADEAL